MNKIKRLHNLIKDRIIVLDGATGTELQKKGLPGSACPEKWCLENPEITRGIHQAYKLAGANIIYSCTLGASGFKLEQYGIRESVYQINRDLACLARQSAGRTVLVAGDIGPTGSFVEPFGPLGFESAVAAFKEQVRGLIDGGCDLIVVETMIDVQEARAALLAVKETADIFTIACLTFEEDGHTLNGTDPISALITLQSLGADAVGCNCSTGPQKMLDFITAMKPYAIVPLIAKPNAGVPRLKNGKTVFGMDARTFGAFGLKLARAGANMIGGCCGTTPEHIHELSRQVRDIEPHPPVRKSIAALSSSRAHLLLERNKPLFVVGERINPTGKKALQQELSERKTSLLRQMAVEQEKQGADLLDINVGQPGINEVRTIKTAIGVLTTATRLPLVVDSAQIETIEAALRIYPGRMLINSISGEKEKMARLLPLAAKYGAMFVLLPLTAGEIPATTARRQEVIKNIYHEARASGFTKDDFIVDCLVMAVASDPVAALETLQTLSWCSKTFRARTILGLSNVSFGMPGRPWLNAAFLAMAQFSGLTMAIANPAGVEFMNIKKAGDTLTAREKGTLKYIEHFAAPSGATAGTAAAGNLSEPEKVTSAIMDGDRENISGLIEKSLAAGYAASGLVDKIMIPAIVRVGELYEKKIYFLPQLMASAETMKAALSCLEPYLKESAGSNKGKILIATVRGDIHDIGKNIVALLLRNYGYNVMDLGKDVSAHDIVDCARKEKPDFIGLSALMTTTMVNMKDVIDAVRAQGIKTKFILGGAVVNEAYAHSIGAAFAKDGVEAVKVLEGLIKKQ